MEAPFLRYYTFFMYTIISNESAYELFNGGGVIWVCTRGEDGRYNLAPIGWNCPLDYDPVSRILFVIDPGHRTFANIKSQGSFAAALPSYFQKDLVERTGSISGAEADKFERFSIPSRRGATVDVRIPEEVAAWVECRLLEIHRIGSVALVAAEVLHAEARKNAWELKLYHRGEQGYYKIGNRL